MPNSTASLSALVVEDDDDHFALLKRVLKRGMPKREITVSRASSLAEARSYVAEHKPDLIFLDLGLPDSSPEQTLEKGIADFTDSPVIVLTSLSDPDTGAIAIAKGAQDYLSKENVSAELVARASYHALERFAITRELERQNEGLKSFAHTIAHEFKTPLQPIIVTLAMLGDEKNSLTPEARKKLIKLSLDSVNHLKDLTTELLQVAEATSKLPSDLIDLNSVLAEVADSSRLALGSTFDLNLPSGVPPVRGSRVQIRQLFENLVSNAIRYRHPDRRPQIDISWHKPDESAPGFVIIVKDNGIGIADEHREKIFEPFFRVTKNSSVTGTGLGLNYCNMTAKHHGGTITIKSELGLGSEFTVSFPGDIHDPS